MYVRLKHALSDYAIAAVRAPNQARAAAWLAGYAALAPDGGALPLSDARAAAVALAAPVRWEIAEADLAAAAHHRLLWSGHGVLSLPRPFRPFAPYFRTQAARLLAAVLHLVRHPTHPTVAEAAYPGLVLCDFGLFFAAHEYLEGEWRAASGSERFAYHGLIQIAAAFYHHEKANAKGAGTLLRRALDKLEQAHGTHLGLDIDAIAAQMTPWDDRFARGAKEPWPAFVVPVAEARR